MPIEVKRIVGDLPLFRSDKDAIALQAADMLAWHIQKESVGKNLVRNSNISEMLFPRDRHFHLAVPREKLFELAAYLKTLENVQNGYSKKMWKQTLNLIERK